MGIWVWGSCDGDGREGGEGVGVVGGCWWELVGVGGDSGSSVSSDSTFLRGVVWERRDVREEQRIDTC